MIRLHRPLRVPFAIAVALAAGALAAPAHAQSARSLVAHPGGGDAAWYTVGLAAQPAPVNDLAHAIDVPAGACFTAPCVEVSIDGTDLRWANGTEWTGRTAFATLDANGNAISDPRVTIVGGTGIAQARVENRYYLYDNVRYRIANRGTQAVKVNVWAQLTRPIRQVYGIAPTGADNTLVASGQTLNPFNGRIATTEADVWPVAPPVASTRASDGITSVKVALDRPSQNTEATFAQTHQAPWHVYEGRGVQALPADFDGARLVNKASGLCLAIDTSGSPYGARASLAACNAAPDRTWYLTNGGGDQRIIAAGASGHCLDLPGETRAYGARVVTGTCTGHDSQRWVLSGYSLQRPETTVINTNSGLCLDVAGHATHVGAPVTQGTCTGHPSQRWALEGDWYGMTYHGGR